MTEARWFGTAGGKFFHALSAGSDYSVCHRGIVLDQGDPMPVGPADLCVARAGHKRTCSKCVIRLERLARVAEKRAGRLTASQAWEQLGPAQREALLGWFLGSYAPSTYAQRYPLIKNDLLTSAACAVGQHWKGAV